MNKDLAISDLTARFGAKLSLASADREQHGADESSHAVMMPDAVLHAGTTEEVADAVRICARHRMPVIPFGAGTSLEGHVTAPHGGLTIDLSLMNRVLAVNEADLDVRVQAGVTRQALNTHLRDKGLFFPVDPGADCTLGGMVGTRASGTNAVRYGTMREQLLSLQVVTATGEIIETGNRARKSAAGYDLTHLFAGSEGTLGVVTEMSLRVYGRPEKLMAGVCHFPNLDAATSAVIATIQMGLPVARIELLDELSVKAVNTYSGLEHKEAPTLFLEFHGSAAAVDAEVSAFSELASEMGGSDIEFAERQEDINKLWHARHQLYYATRAMAPGKHIMTTDVCVPISRLGDCMRETRFDMDESPIVGTMVGHVGDGNFHTILLADPNNLGEMRALDDLHDRMVTRAIEMGGTCTGEHGIGLGKMKYLEQEKGPALHLMRQIKAALDPIGIMNPGKLLPGMDSEP
ncbi:FAD-binding oxidoreductase [Kordiimonas lipolytica]|uniref:D-lactate dehydrogenase (cytochrome) n=1 Tax=Kordiimonas lipolytica TaxID=1662421 RepID=A0ABV8UCU8_9PROT|nr:FAD-linked oxidase C-terminal domain-containing protein [Kordiimonas lipolytica]